MGIIAIFGGIFLVNLDRIKERTKELGWSMSFLCKQLGLSQSYFTDVKNKKTVISDERLHAIADILNCSVEYLAGNSSEVSKTPPEYDSFFAMQKAISKIEESEANTYTIHGSQGKGTVVKSTAKNKCALIGNGKTYDLTQAEFAAIESVIKAMRTEK